MNTGRLVFLILIAALCPTASADWYPADLPYADYISEPITSISAVPSGRIWTVSDYWYYFQDKDHIRWNSNVWFSENDGALWDYPLDGYEATPQFADVRLFSAAFSSDECGWIFGVQRPDFLTTDPDGPLAFLRTTDGGITWSVSNLPNNDPVPTDPPNFGITAADENHAVAVRGRHVYETTDGTNWTEHSGAWPELYAVVRRSEEIHACGVNTIGRITPNGFASDWTGTASLYALDLPDSGTGYAVGVDGQNGVVYRTTNGTDWNLCLSVPAVVFRAVAATDAEHGWVVGEIPGDPPSGVVYRTTDAGVSWRFDTTIPGGATSIGYRDAQHIWIGGRTGLWVYTPPIGDLNRNGYTSLTEATAIMRASCGLNISDDLMTSRGDCHGDDGRLTLADAVTALRTAVNETPDYVDIDVPSGVVVVYNTISADTDANGVKDSLQVAGYYAERRGIPQQNLVPITWHNPDYFSDKPRTSGRGRANWTDAYLTVVKPLKERIQALGREKVHTIVFTLGTPYKFLVNGPDNTWVTEVLDNALNDLWAVDERNWSSWQPYGAPMGSLDERYSRFRLDGPYRPPGRWSHGRQPWYLVSRIDGPSLDVCLSMIDNALFAERYLGPGGYTGTAYIDTRASRYGRPPYDLAELREFLPSFYNYGDMDKSIARSILTFADRNRAWKDEVTGAVIGGPPEGNGPVWRDGSPASNAPRAVMYTGWYNYGTYYNVWDWLPGSVAVDFNSASAYAFRGHPTVPYFAPGALSHGVTALVGSITEPYNYHPQPDALMEYLARGFSFGEAAMLSTPVIRSGKAMFLGDPLYRPCAPKDVIPVPVPTLSGVFSASAGARVLRVETDIPTRATALYTTDGTTPGTGSPQAQGTPVFFSRFRSFTLPADGPLAVLVRMEDATGRITESPILRP
jgi:photosystem II stability/assembly factor-like uncharacterized protein